MSHAWEQFKTVSPEGKTAINQHLLAFIFMAALSNSVSRRSSWHLIRDIPVHYQLIHSHLAFRHGQINDLPQRKRSLEILDDH